MNDIAGRKLMIKKLMKEFEEEMKTTNKEVQQLEKSIEHKTNILAQKMLEIETLIEELKKEVNNV